jgi:hypothetical protein
MNGLFMAFNADTGQLLFTSLIGEPIGGGIITYNVGGKQFVAVAAGMKEGYWPTHPVSSSRIIVYGL